MWVADKSGGVLGVTLEMPHSQSNSSERIGRRHSMFGRSRPASRDVSLKRRILESQENGTFQTQQCDDVPHTTDNSIVPNFGIPTEK